MRKVNKYQIITDSYEAAEAAVNYINKFYYNPPTIIDYKGKKYITSAGNSDNITIFVNAEEICILCQNSDHEYCSAQFLDASTGTETASIFLQGEDIYDKSLLSYKLARMDPRKAFNIISQYYIN
jgi:hypothetical protein